MGVGNKWSVSWLEVLFLALLVFSGLGLWFMTEHEVNAYLKSKEPREEDFQRQYNISLLEANVAQVKANMTAWQTKISARRRNGRSDNRW